MSASSPSSGAGLVAIYQCSSSQLAQVTLLTGGDAAAASYICGSVDVSTVGATNAVLQWTVSQIHDLQSTNEELTNGLNTWFVLSSAYNVFMMQTGFALYAAGVVRAKNVHMILLKNFTDACISAITFYVVGFAFAFGARDGSTNGFIGNWDFALSQTSSENPQPYHVWFWNWTFAAASCTILSGSIAERATFHAYLIYSTFMTAWVYPVVAHWLWSPFGWLSAYNANSILGAGAIDFSGSGVVHMVGGFSSIMASIATGPRVGRFDNALPMTVFKNQSAPLYVLGTFLLWFGWFGFNPGSVFSVSTFVNASSVTRTAVCTTISAGAGAVSAMFLVFWRTRTWDTLAVCTGALAGMVAITAPCSTVEPWAAIICGTVAGPIYVYGEALIEYLEIDDPVGAFPVHGLCGAWGVLFPGLLAVERYVVDIYKKPYGKHLKGIFYGGHGQFLLCQVIAILVIAGWSAFWNGCLFFGLKFVGQLRVPLELEAQGMDAQAGTAGMMGDPLKMTKFADISNKGSHGPPAHVLMVEPPATFGPAAPDIVTMPGNGYTAEIDKAMSASMYGSIVKTSPGASASRSTSGTTPLVTINEYQGNSSRTRPIQA